MVKIHPNFASTFKQNPILTSDFESDGFCHLILLSKFESDGLISFDSCNGLNLPPANVLFSQSSIYSLHNHLKKIMCNNFLFFLLVYFRKKFISVFLILCVHLLMTTSVSKEPVHNPSQSLFSSNED